MHAMPEADSEFVCSENSFNCYQANELNYLNARKPNSGRLQLLHRTVSLYSADLMKSAEMLKNVKFKMFAGNLRNCDKSLHPKI